MILDLEKELQTILYAKGVKYVEFDENQINFIYKDRMYSLKLKTGK